MNEYMAISRQSRPTNNTRKTPFRIPMQHSQTNSQPLTVRHSSYELITAHLISNLYLSCPLS